MSVPEERSEGALSVAEVEARLAKLKHDAREYEFRYELSPEKMRRRLEEGKERKTKDVLKWMTIFDALQSLQAEYPDVHVETPTPAIEKGLDPGWKRSADDDDYCAQLRRSIATYEAIYEMDSAEMADLLSDEKVKETNEIIEWMSDCKELRRMEEAPRDSEGNIIPPRMTDAEVVEQVAQFRLNIRDYEERYKMSSAQMLALLEKGEIEETIEIIEWKFDLRDLRVMEKEIPISGKPTTAIKPSIISD